METSCCPPSFTSSTITSSSSSSSNSTTTTIDHNAGTTGGGSVAVPNALRQLNKSSYKISKQSCSAGSSDSGNPSHHKSQPPPLPPPAAPLAASPPTPPSEQQQQPTSPPPPAQQQPQPQPQPPVYNIHKNNFRDVVQKLTGSPAHRPRVSSAPAAPAPSPRKNVGGGTSSRLQKIRPPPLAQLTSRPPPPLAPESNPLPQAGGDAGGGAAWARPSPLSPLPPFPAVSAAAESPITAYMRYLRSGATAHQQALIPSPRGGSSGGILLPLAPSSPLAFGFVPSPRSACQGMLSQGLLFPPSPTPSPRLGDQ